MIVDFTDKILEAKEKKTLNKPFRTPGGPKKFSVYVKNEKGNVVKVNFGDPNMEIKRDDPARRKSFRARHNCDNPGPKTKHKRFRLAFGVERLPRKAEFLTQHPYSVFASGHVCSNRQDLLSK